MVALVAAFKPEMPQWRAGINPRRICPVREQSPRPQHRRNGGRGLIPAGFDKVRDLLPFSDARRNGGRGLIPAGSVEARLHTVEDAMPQWRAGINPRRIGAD